MDEVMVDTVTGISYFRQDLIILKSDLRKLVVDAHRKAPAQYENVLEHAIHNGRLEVVRAVEKLIGGE